MISFSYCACLNFKIPTMTNCLLFMHYRNYCAQEWLNKIEMKWNEGKWSESEEMQFVYHPEHTCKMISTNMKTCVSSERTDNRIGGRAFVRSLVRWDVWMETKNEWSIANTWHKKAIKPTTHLYISRTENIVLWVLRAFTWDVYNAHGANTLTLSLACSFARLFFY